MVKNTESGYWKMNEILNDKSLTKLCKNFSIDEFYFAVCDALDWGKFSLEELSELKEIAKNKSIATKNEALTKIFDKLKIKFINELSRELPPFIADRKQIILYDNKNRLRLKSQKLYDKIHQEVIDKLPKEDRKLLGYK